VAAGLLFCPSCGTRLAAPSGPACAVCGAAAQPGARFCGVCGTTLGSTRPGSPAIASAPRGPGGIALLVVDENGRELSRHPMSSDETTIGRGDADVAFPEDQFLSPLHAKLTYRDGQLLLRDLGSRNNTWYFIDQPYKMVDGDLLLIGSQVLRFRRLGYPGPHPPEHDATRRMGSLIPSADIARLTQLRADGSERDVCHLSPGRHLTIGREKGDWIFPFDPSMSSVHAQIRSEDADFVAVDAGSRNGVAVAVRGEVTLGNGSRMLVGDKLIRLVTP
jgi:pSer/pThr/pTyr-binding forkhead associated (FHA) protein